MVCPVAHSPGPRPHDFRPIVTRPQHFTYAFDSEETALDLADHRGRAAGDDRLRSEYFDPQHDGEHAPFSIGNAAECRAVDAGEVAQGARIECPVAGQ